MNVEDILLSYERSVVDEVREWLNREPGSMDRLLGGVSSRSRQALDLVLETGPGRRALQAATERVSAALEDAVLLDLEDRVKMPTVPVDPQGRQAALRRADERARDLRGWYVGALGAQGALVGAASVTMARSAVAVAADVTVAVVVTLRAAAHLLGVYGVVPSHPSALRAAIDLVAAATETDAAVRERTILSVIRRLVEQLPDVHLAPELPRVVVQQVGSRAFKEAIEQTVRTILRRRLAGLVPVLGAAAGGAASGWLATQVCEASRQVGRTYFLVRHTSLQVDDVVVDIAVSAGSPS